MTEILDIANQMAQDLFKVGAMDEITMRKIDALCLPAQRLLDLIDRKGLAALG